MFHIIGINTSTQGTTDGDTSPLDQPVQIAQHVLG